MKNDLGRFTIQKLRAILKIGALALVALASLSLAEIKHLKLNYDLTGFLPKRDKSLEAEAAMMKKYRLSDDPTLVLVAHRYSGWLEPDAIGEIALITSQIEALPNVKSVTSLTTLETIRGDQESLKIGKMVDHFSTSHWRSLVQQSAIASPLLVSRDQKTTALIVTIVSKDAAQSVADLIRKVLHARSHQTHSKMQLDRYEMTGVSLIQSEMSKALNHEFIALGGIGVLVAAGSLTLLFSGYTGFAIALITASIANLLILGGLSYFGIAIGILSLSLPIMIAVQTLSLTVHILFTYREIRLEYNRDEALMKSFRQLLFPNFIVSLATGIGFLVLTTSPVEAMKQFGWTVSISSLVLWFSTTIFAFLILMFAPEPRLRSFVSGQARWVLCFTRNSRMTLTLFTAVFFVTALSGMKLNYSHTLFDANTPSARAATTVDAHLGGMIPVEIELRLTPSEIGNAESWTDEKHLPKISNALERVRNLPHVASAFGLPDIFALAPTTKSSDLLVLLELSSKNPLPHFLRDDGTATRIQVRFRDVRSDELNRAITSTLSILGSITHLPAANISVSGWGAYLHRMNQTLSQSLMNGFWEALLAIAVVLALAFKSIRWAIAALVPSVFPPLVLLGGLTFSNFPVKPGLAVVFTISLGFAFINSIYLLKRLQYMFEQSEVAQQSTSARQRELRWRKLVEKSFWKESQSCLLASLVLILGFVSLCFSQFEVSRSFGIAMVIAMILGLIGDLILLPALLYEFPKFLLGGNMNPTSSLTKMKSDPILQNPAPSRLSLWFLISGPLLATGFWGTPSAASAIPENESISFFASQAFKRLYPEDKKLARDERVEIELRNIDPNGDTEVKKLEVARLTLGKGRKTESRVLAKVIAPKNLKGTSVLTVSDGEHQSRWIYLPSSKNVRRIIGAEDSHAPLLGSELSTEDLDLGQIDGASAKIVGRDGGIVRIETKIRSKESAYSMCLAQFDEKTYLFKTADCLDKKGLPAKRISILNYRVLKGKIARPAEMEIINLKTKRISRVKFSEQKIGAGLSAVGFTPEAMRD